jgi:signal transduction histidine kinase
MNRLMPMPTMMRVAIVVTALTFCSNVALLGFIHLRTRDDAMVQLHQRVEEESVALSGLTRFRNLKELQRMVSETLVSGDPQLIVAIVSSDGRPLAGNIRTRLPLSFLKHRGFQTTVIENSNDGKPLETGLVVSPLAIGGALVSGRVFSERLSLQATLERSLLLALGLSLIFGLGSGLVTARYIGRRVRAIAFVVDDVGDGNLSQRAPIKGANDAFDELSARINLMLSRISTLMAEMRLMTDSLAHDLRSPISRLRSYIERAMIMNDEAQRQSHLTSALQEADSLTRMLGTVLEIGRAESMDGRERFVQVDLAAIVRELADMYEPLIEDKGITLVQDYDDVAQPYFAHPQLIAQAVSNLIDNAIHHAASGRKISLSVHHDSNKVYICIADSGEGIAAEDRDEARRRFGRLDAARSTQGAGLGLALVESIAHLHSGVLELADNAPGLRATIILSVKPVDLLAANANLQNLA